MANLAPENSELFIFQSYGTAIFLLRVTPPPTPRASNSAAHQRLDKMSLLAAHLEQIAYSCEGIDSLP